MLPRALRLPVSMAKHGKKVQALFFSAYIKENEGVNNRFLFVVGKMAVKTAARRNRIKRILGEAAKGISPRGMDATVVASPNIEKADFKTLTKELEKVLK